MKCIICKEKEGVIIVNDIKKEICKTQSMICEDCQREINKITGFDIEEYKKRREKILKDFDKEMSEK